MKFKWMNVIVSLLSLLLLFVVYYLAIPALNLKSIGFWGFLAFVFFVLSLNVLLWTHDSELTSCVKKIRFVHCFILLALAVILIGGFFSTNLFFARSAAEVAQVTEVEDFSEGFSDILETGSTYSNLPIVDYDTAKLLGDKKVAGLKNSTWYDVDDEYNLIRYNGKYYRLSVIDYGRFFKWTKAKEAGLPGYVLVDVVPKKGTVVEEAQIVLTEEPIRYSPGAYFSHDLKRHLRFQFPSAIFDKSYLEIDEEGTPFWITGVKMPTKFLFGVPVIDSLIITNAITGESYMCNIDETPEWIDHVFSLTYVMNITHKHYAYVNGFWNNLFSKTGVLRTSYDYRDKHKNSEDSEAGKFANFYGYSSVVGPDGDIYFYTGLTAANNAESNLGWLLINTRTGAVTQYNVVGAEESSAQAAVETLVQAQRWEATFPLPVNIGGEPSYLMALKGKSGLVQGYGIVNVDNYSIAVYDSTLEGAINAYLLKCGKTDKIDVEDEAKDEVATETKSGEISAIYTAEVSGTTQFYYVIDGEQLYRCSITVNEKQVLFKVGDRVTFEAEEQGEIKTIIKISLE
ncbi:hypothetical protein IKF85_01815 [Candidatus Saccharibacteria bacterium]|nr:hypothetical protein [Candidatus Saccharibacteria bacterium]